MGTPGSELRVWVLEVTDHMAFGLDLRQGISPIGTGRTDFYNMRAAPKQPWKSTIGTYSTSAGEWPRPKPQTNEQNVPQEPTHTGSSFIATTALCRASSRSLAACHLYSLGTKLRAGGSFGVQALIPIGSIVVPCWGSYLESYKVIPRGTAMEPWSLWVYMKYPAGSYQQAATRPRYSRNIRAWGDGQVEMVQRACPAGL